ncbi:hypothetical protein SAMN05421688_0730 [Poseidonocella pacifica]|uniref:Uncharacterized protein n=1 Tax=Poseidonocella pacifica TaxID=871651 RepID=A0A1I0VKF0_9RHOB|nr:hypothetical protein [Poseidonocella pacifica]SFA76885.1 hypothetical protein SAMN05421688_0730 [Poseidonocella pacifica]
MTNILAFRPLKSRPDLTERCAALTTCFAAHRRSESDVFWLKENAELLNIMESGGLRPGTVALAPLGHLYETILERIAFFPQYYRFFLSICLDLEDLGMTGEAGLRMSEWIAAQGLPEGELSDLQRLEAQRLLARRGVDAMPHDPGLADRVRRFIRRPHFFAVPNKKAAYELTHAVFYLSEYGRRDPLIDAETAQSLHFAGILALLDQNVDLLAEICIAMRFAALDVPDYWESWIARSVQSYELRTGPEATVNDDYHSYFMVNWLQAVRGAGAFDGDYSPDRMSFFRMPTEGSALRGLSRSLLSFDGVRRGDWKSMQAEVEKNLEISALNVLNATEESTPFFDAFFECFARTASV